MLTVPLFADFGLIAFISDRSVGYLVAKTGWPFGSIGMPVLVLAYAKVVPGATTGCIVGGRTTAVIGINYLKELVQVTSVVVIDAIVSLPISGYTKMSRIDLTPYVFVMFGQMASYLLSSTVHE